MNFYSTNEVRHILTDREKMKNFIKKHFVLEVTNRSNACQITKETEKDGNSIIVI